MANILLKFKEISIWLDKKFDSNELGFGDLMYKQAGQKNAGKDMSLKLALSFVVVYVIFFVLVLVAQYIFGFSINLPL